MSRLSILMNQPNANFIYRVRNIPELRNLVVALAVKGEGLTVWVTGISSPWIRFFIKRFLLSHTSLGALDKRNGANIYSIYFPPIPSSAHERMFESVISTLIYKRPVPLAATIGITGQCQYSCNHCSAAGRDPKRPDMSYQEIRRVIDECLALGVSNITFTGGEPLLNKDIMRLIASVPGELAVTQVFTNAAALSSSMIAELKSAGLYGLQVSLDSADPIEHDQMRGFKGAFTAVGEGVREARKKGLLVGISTYATRDRIERGFLPDVASLVQSWGANEITVFDAIETGRLRGKKELLIDKLSRRRLIADMKIINRRYRNKLRVVTQSWTNSGQSFSRFIGCLAAKFQIHITAQGDLTPCDFTPLSFGNIRESSVGELWHCLTSHPAYQQQALNCRMQNPDFRKQYIDTIPEGAYIPYRIT
jgi:MoaA/NifB/PqqE/SkfB family radical SAM enzyme